MNSTIRDVAKLAEVSVATVSRVVNELGGVKPETEQKVLRAMDELNYIPNVLARSVKSQKTYLIGMIVPDIENPFFAAVYSGVNSIARKHAYTTLLGDSENNVKVEEDLMHMIFQHRASGIILTPVQEHLDWFEQSKYDIPLCLVDRKLDGIDCDGVLIDNQSGSYDATELFIQSAHKKIGIITGPLDSTPGKERFVGYCKCLKKNGIEYDPNIIQTGDFGEKSGYLLGIKLLNIETRPTAILSCNNLMTLGLLEAISSIGLHIGKDISVIGFDDIPIATIMEPKLTVVSRPMREMGEAAAKLLLGHIENPNIPNQNIMMSPRLIVRGSESIIR